jgi:putative metallohydrolase (TIGR04338 family)
MSEKNPQWYELPRERWQADPRRKSYRDSQKQKLYDAESVAKFHLNDIRTKFSSIEEIQKFVNELLSSAWIKKRFGDNKCEVRAARKNQHDAYARMSYISLPKWAWTKMVVLHEVTHILTRYYEGSHGRYFARAFLEIIEHVLGHAARIVLKKQYRVYNVKHNPNKLITEADRKARSDRFKQNVLKQKVTV